MDYMQREFEKYFSKPPFEFDMAKYTSEGSWPGNYLNYSVQCAFEGFCEGRAVLLVGAEEKPPSKEVELMPRHVRALIQALREAEAWRGCFGDDPGALDAFDKFLEQADEALRIVKSIAKEQALLRRSKKNG